MAVISLRHDAVTSSEVYGSPVTQLLGSRRNVTPQRTSLTLVRVAAEKKNNRRVHLTREHDGDVSPDATSRLLESPFNR